MLARFFDSATRIQALHDGPAGTLFEAFAQALAQDGYAEITARRHLRAAEHFIDWADRTGIAVRGPVEQALDRFDRHLRCGRCPRFGHAHRVNVLHGARLFLKCLQDASLIESPVVESSVPGPTLFMAFSQWMYQQRGSCESTLYNYGIHIREVLKRLGEDPAMWDARSLRQFVVEGSQTCGWAAAKKRTTALRMFLRFLIAEGKCASGLDGAIPVLAHWRLSSLPRYLPADDVERVIVELNRQSKLKPRSSVIKIQMERVGGNWRLVELPPL